MHWSIPST